jgi:hypothetical protein
VGLDNPDLAAAILEPFALERVTPRAAAKLVALMQRCGLGQRISHGGFRQGRRQARGLRHKNSGRRPNELLHNFLHNPKRCRPTRGIISNSSTRHGEMAAKLQ